MTDLLKIGEDFNDFTKAVNHGLVLYALRRRKNSPIVLTQKQIYAVYKNIDSQYYRFTIPKKSGEERVIEAPTKNLKSIQRGINELLHDVFTPEDQAHGFAIGKSIHTNSDIHIENKWILNIDIKDFFPSVSKGRLITVLQLNQINRSRFMANKIALFCTHRKQLPQGAPTSPTLTNIVSRRLDIRLKGLANSYNFNYSRYADDITFSGPSKSASKKILSILELILKLEGFELNKAKTRLLPSSLRQEVTGLTVNLFRNTTRKYRRNIRAILNNCNKTTISEVAFQNGYESSSKFISSLRGKINFLVHTSKTKEVLRLQEQFIKLTK